MARPRCRATCTSGSTSAGASRATSTSSTSTRRSTRRYLDDATPQMEQRYLVATQLLFHPSGARVRESLSYDLPLLWPLDFARAVGLVQGRAARGPAALSRRASARGSSSCRRRRSRAPGRSRGCVGVEQMQLYDFNPAARRAYIVPDALMGPDVTWQIEGLFQARFDPASGVLVSEPPPPAAGIPGTPVPGVGRLRRGRPEPRRHPRRTPGRRLPRAARHLQARLGGRRRRRAGAADARQRALSRGASHAPATHLVTFTYRPRQCIYEGLRSPRSPRWRWRCGVRGRPATERGRAPDALSDGARASWALLVVALSFLPVLGALHHPPHLLRPRPLVLLLVAPPLAAPRDRRRRGAVVGSVRRRRAVGDRRRPEPAADADHGGHPAAAVGRRRLQPLGRAAAAAGRARDVPVPAPPHRRTRAPRSARARSRCRDRSSRCSTRRTCRGRSR